MPTIKIKTDEFTANACALEAVGKWMIANYHERRYQKARVFEVKSGRTLKVEELAEKKGMSVCSCTFRVTRVKEAQ